MIGSVREVSLTLVPRSSKYSAWASVPFIAQAELVPAEAGTGSGPSVMVELFDHFPSRGEYIQVRRKTGTEDVHLSPVFRVDVAGTGAEISGVGKEKHRLLDKSYHISLQSTSSKVENTPKNIEW